MNAPQTAYDWFARSAAAHGHEVTALEVGGEELSYGALRELAERLAARLVAANGGRPPRRVGLLAGRSVTAYAGYLAALRAGAAVVPLNPESPPARSAAVVASAGLDLVLADAHAAADAEADLGAPVLVVGAEERAALARDPAPDLPPTPTGPDDLAYLLFTSGSTGAPKGVPISHRNLSAYLGLMTTRYGVGPGSRMSQNFELTFDGSVHDLFVAWAGGGTLVVPTRGQLLSPVRTVNKLGLTHWFSVPSLISFASRLGTLRPGSMPTLRWSVFGGEPLTLAAAREWRSAAPGSRIEVLYGPTELTISCTGHLLPDDPDAWPTTPNGTAPIGEGHPGLDLLLRGDDGAPGDVGELCVRGPQRFPGYLDPANDAGRFLTPDGRRVADGRVTDRHWYRTGDRVAVLDGVLVHLGRTDHQVKLRGHRVELGEIEVVLRQQPGVREAIVVPVATADGEVEVEAAVTGPGCDPDVLYAALAARLPPYMRPRRITVLDQLPLNGNGKIDRSAVLAHLGQAR
ncbi:amino acid adenylation domain-containing protein [Streptomyces avicenniae]|uniref:amino acid adenylation domain-containing protein n=1 Tax=Streptomyces avicenniae TaxID=500153 RepID=UPI00069CA68E|nr:amino acid adenylation domain-containing protein [Streptomyces avicenniae]